MNIGEWTHNEAHSIIDDAIYEHPGLIGNRVPVDNAHTLRLLTPYSVTSAVIGGGGRWPKLHLEVEFQVGEEDLRQELAEELMSVVSEFFKDK